MNARPHPLRVSRIAALLVTVTCGTAVLSGCSAAPRRTPIATTRSLTPAPWDPYTSAEKTLMSIDTAEAVILNNVANSETQTFKRSSVRWLGDGEIATDFDFSPGAPTSTGKPTDIAIDGDGFLCVKGDDAVGDGVAYTRNGNFYVNPKGELVLGMGDGSRLVPSIVIPKGVPERDISIAHNGAVFVRLQGEASRERIGQIQLHHFQNNCGLAPIGNHMFVETAASGPSIASEPGSNDACQLISGFLEGSNVDPAREEIDLRRIRALRVRLENLTKQ